MQDFKSLATVNLVIENPGGIIDSAVGIKKKPALIQVLQPWYRQPKKISDY